MDHQSKLRVYTMIPIARSRKITLNWTTNGSEIKKRSKKIWETLSAHNSYH